MINNQILVFGDTMLDKYIFGNVTRISPEAPVPVINVVKEENRIGGAGNVALNIKKLGQPVMLLGQVGFDENGTTLQDLLKHEEITFHPFYTQLPTICKVRLIGNNQQIARLDYEKYADYGTISVKDLLKSTHPKVVVISDYNKGLCKPDALKDIISFSKDNDVRVIVDPKGNNWKKYRGAYLITPNWKEFCELVGKIVPNENQVIEKYAETIRTDNDIANLLITRSEKGMTLVSKDGISHFPTHAQSVYDVTGAGDTVIASIAVFLSEGCNLIEAINRSNLAASIAVSKFGTYAVSWMELEPIIKKNKYD